MPRSNNGKLSHADLNPIGIELLKKQPEVSVKVASNPLNPLQKAFNRILKKAGLN